MEDKKFIWKKSDQNKYYQIACNNYIRELFQFIKNKNYVFYLEYEPKKDFDLICKYYNGENINIEDFEKTKQFKPYYMFPLFKFYDDIYDVDSCNVAFSITHFDEECDEESNMSGCGQCHIKYGANICFGGLAYNTGLNENDPKEPIEYEGYIKTYNFFRCNCKDDENQDEIICLLEKYTNDDGKECYDHNVPFCVMNTNPINNKYNISFTHDCINFNIRYQKNCFINKNI